MEPLLQENIGIAQDDWIGSDDEITGLHDTVVTFPFCPLQDHGRQSWSKRGGLVAPVGQHAGRCHDEAWQVSAATPFFLKQVTERLHGFA